jgi:hypothetical protein
MEGKLIAICEPTDGGGGGTSVSIFEAFRRSWEYQQTLDFQRRKYTNHAMSIHCLHTSFLSVTPISYTAFQSFNSR